MKLWFSVHTTFSLSAKEMFPIEYEQAEQEFLLNWGCQVPHWHYLSKEGIKFLKGKNA